MKEAACFQGKQASRWLEGWPLPFRLLRHKKASSPGSIVATVKSASMGDVYRCFRARSEDTYRGETPMRCAIYARVSTKDKGQEVENQLRQLREFAALRGWTVYREYVDHETGKNDDRGEFQAMFRDASQRKFEVLLFWALDRLSREGVLETLQHLNRLTSYGVGYRSFTEQYFDSCGIFKDAVIAIVATVAKQERVRISERVKAGLETARAKGKKLGRPRGAYRMIVPGTPSPYLQETCSTASLHLGASFPRHRNRSLVAHL